MDELLLIIIVLLPLIYTIFFFWYASKSLKELNDVKMAVLQIATSKAGLEDVIEDIGDDLDYVSKQTDQQTERIKILSRRVDDFSLSVRTLAGEIGKK